MVPHLARPPSTSKAIALAWRGLGAALAITCGACSQRDDVVAQISALADGGPPPADAMPPPPPTPAPTPDAGPTVNCEPSQYYVLFSSIVNNGCKVPVSPEAKAIVSAFFAQQPPPQIQSGEARPPSYCELNGGFPFGFYWGGMDNSELFLCPAYCDMAAATVHAEEQRLLDCQGFGGS